MDQKMLIIGANGQLGKALQQKYPRSKTVDFDELDITDPKAVSAFDWDGIKTVFNAAAYTDVDGAETPEGRIAAWKANATAVTNLVNAALKNDFLIIHISTDYVFDGSQNLHREDEAFSPLSVYGASKAAGDLALSVYPKYYLLRTSWLIGDGKNFARTMLELGKKGISPTVVADQVGRPTFSVDLVEAIDHLLKTQANFGTYNISGAGDPVNWADLSRAIFQEAGLPNKVTDTTTSEYYKDKPTAATRPLNSLFDLSKIEATGFKPEDWHVSLKNYIEKELQK